jgi:transposase
MEEIRERILYLRDVIGLSFYQIEEQVGISRKRASRIYRGSSPEDMRKRFCLLDKYHPLISTWFREYPSLKALQVYTWLQERGVKVSYTLVVKYTRELRRKKEKVYHPLHFLPGEEGQVDWCIIPHPTMGKLFCFVLILSYSRYLFAHIFPRSSFEFFIEGHLMAFSAMNGTAHSLRYDNLKSVVISRRPEVRYNPRFLDFSRHYGVEIRLCNPARGNEKGRVERVIRTMRTTFFNNMATYRSLSAINQGLHEWGDNKNNTIHRATGKRPVDLVKEEHLMSLPGIPWQNVHIHSPVKTTKTAMMIFDTNTYSVPDYLVGRALSIHATPTTVKIYDGNKEVASHPRLFERCKQIINPLHRSYSKLSTKAKMQRIHEVISGLHPAVEEFLSKNQTCGEDPQKTAYQIFKLLKQHSRGMIISVISECIKRRSPRVKTLLSYLQIQPAEEKETVCPQNPDLLNITYKARALEEYEDESE